MMLRRSIFRKLQILLVLLATLYGCREEVVSPSDLVSISVLQDSFLLFSPDDSKVSFDITTEEQEGNEIEYVKVLISNEDGRSYEFQQVSTFPARIEMNLRQAVSSIADVELADLNRGGFLRVRFLAKKKKFGEEPLTKLIDLSLTCPEPGIAGMYDTFSYGVSGPGGGGRYADITSQIEITAVSEYEFLISDATGGVFKEIWAAKPEQASLIENCRVLDFPSFTDQFDDTFTGTAKLQADGSIELKWQSSYGDAGTTVFRKR